MTATKLESEFKSMVSYGTGPATLVEVTHVLDYWPDKQVGDVGWAYVAIANDTFAEAVTVVVADEGGRHVVRQVEWGRP